MSEKTSGITTSVFQSSLLNYGSWTVEFQNSVQVKKASNTWWKTTTVWYLMMFIIRLFFPNPLITIRMLIIISTICQDTLHDIHSTNQQLCFLLSRTFQHYLTFPIDSLLRPGQKLHVWTKLKYPQIEAMLNSNKIIIVKNPKMRLAMYSNTKFQFNTFAINLKKQHSMEIKSRPEKT